MRTTRIAPHEPPSPPHPPRMVAVAATLGLSGVCGVPLASVALAQKFCDGSDYLLLVGTSLAAYLASMGLGEWAGRSPPGK